MEAERELEEFERREAVLITNLIHLALKRDVLGVFCTLNAITDLARQTAKEEREKREKAERISAAAANAQNDFFVIQPRDTLNCRLETPNETGALSPIAVWSDGNMEDDVV